MLKFNLINEDMPKKLLIIIFVFIVYVNGQIHILENMSVGIRDDDTYCAWIFFVDKIKSINKISVSNKTLIRRNKGNPYKNYEWYDQNPSEEYVTKVLNTGAKLRHRSRWLNAISIECSESELIEISNMPFVKDIKPVNQYRRKFSNKSISTKSLQKLNSTNITDYGAANEQLEQINIPKAHDEGYFGQGVNILILDSGFNLDHPVFDSLNIVAEWDVINDDSTTKNEDGQDVSTQQNHGTNVFSVLGGYAPGVMVGPAYKANYLLAKTEIVGEEIQVEEDYFVSALEWGEALGADVMSASLGYIDWYSPKDLDGNTAITTNAVDIASDLGVVCITAAGNENGNYWNTITPPADADFVISVGAVNYSGNITKFSSRGPTADGRTKPEVCASGYGVYCASGNSSYVRKNGTSYAAPLVAGGVAILLSAHPNWTPAMVREAILETASQSQNEDNIYGWGIMDVWAAINYDTSNLFTPELYQNFPNPFNSRTTIKYDLKQSSKVKLKIFDILGREITTLVNSFEPSGFKTVSWDGTNKNGYHVNSGVYFYNLNVGESNISQKMLYIK